MKNTEPKWVNSDKIGLSFVRNGIVVYLDSGDEFDEITSGGQLEVGITVTDDIIDIQAVRAGMKCTPAQIRLALLDMDLLDTVQALADSDPSASIVWEYATAIYRTSPLIKSIKSSDFSDTQIDDIFTYAQGLLP